MAAGSMRGPCGSAWMSLYVKVLWSQTYDSVNVPSGEKEKREENGSVPPAVEAGHLGDGWVC